MPDDVKRPLKVFLCHAHDDKPKVRELYQRLKSNGVDAWLDEEKLLAGHDWDLEIYKATRDADAIIICLSKGAVDKEGYVQKEIRRALDISEEKPDGTIYVIPLRFEECDIPIRLKKYQWVDLFTKGGDSHVMRALKARAMQLECADVQIPQIDESSPNLTQKPEGQAILGPSFPPKQPGIISALTPAGVVPSSSSRLMRALSLVNESRNPFEKITIPRVAHLLGFSLTHEVEACFDGKAEPSVFFLEKFADFFGVNKRWLQFGEGHPFATEEKKQYKPTDYFERIKVLFSKETIFVRENSNNGRTVILLHISEYKYVYFPSEYHVSSHVGGMGRYQLIGLYKLMGKIDEEYLPYSSRQIQTKDFDKLINGDIFPGQIANFPPSYWVTDFLSSDFEDDAKKYDTELLKAHIIIEKEIKPAAQSLSEPQVEIKPSVVIEQVASEKLITFSPYTKKEPQKTQRKLKTEYIIAIIGAVATIFTALIGMLPQIAKFTPTPTSTFFFSLSPTILTTTNPHASSSQPTTASQPIFAPTNTLTSLPQSTNTPQIIFAPTNTFTSLPQLANTLQPIFASTNTLTLLPQSTDTPQPIFTLTPQLVDTQVTGVCDSAQYIGDVNVSPGTVFAPNTIFTKVWRIKNIGICTWTSSYQLVFDSGDIMEGVSPLTLTSPIAPGQSTDISVVLQTPASDGIYRGYWGLNNASGTRVPVSNANTFYVEIEVRSH